MNTQKIIDDSIFILTETYNHNIEPLMNAYDTDCLWIGPAKNRIIRSKEKIREAFATNDRILKYVLYDRTITPTQIGNNCLIVLFTYVMDALYPDNEILRNNCRAELVWYTKNVTEKEGRVKRMPVLRIFQLSHEILYDSRDAIHPVHIREIEENLSQNNPALKEQIIMKDISGSIHFFDSMEIIWIESHGKHSYAHTNKGIHECTDSIAVLEKRYGDTLFRCHSSYLVNPAYICEIKRFFLILSDGTKIPVPEKKYTSVKAALLKQL